MTMDLSILLPAYLEEENLRLILPRIKSQCQLLTESFEIIVIDTMKPLDGTAELCQELGVKHISRTLGNTYGDAVRSGIASSVGNSVVFMDADGSHTPEFIRNLYENKDPNIICVASRYKDGGYTENSLILVWMSMLVNIGYRVVLGINCKDISNSFKLYPGEALRDLKLKCNNFDIVEEILLKVLKQNPEFKISEIPFTFKKRMFGKTKRNLFLFMFTYLVTLFRLKLDL